MKARALDLLRTQGARATRTALSRFEGEKIPPISTVKAWRAMIKKADDVDQTVMWLQHRKAGNPHRPEGSQGSTKRRGLAPARSGPVQDAIGPLAALGDDATPGETAAAAEAACRALQEVSDAQSYPPDQIVPLVTARGAMKRDRDKARREGDSSRSQFPDGLPSLRSSDKSAEWREKLCKALSQAEPAVAVNELVGSRLVEREGALKNQRELFFRVDCRKGTMIPFPGEIRMPSKAASNGYDIYLEACDRELQPDPKSAAAMCNDVYGPDRSDDHKAAQAHLLNLEFATATDVWKRPYVFLRTTRDVQADEAGWTDYGDAYWENGVGSVQLAEESTVYAEASNCLSELEGTCPNNPIAA